MPLESPRCSLISVLLPEFHKGLRYKLKLKMKNVCNILIYLIEHSLHQHILDDELNLKLILVIYCMFCMQIQCVINVSLIKFCC